MLAANIPRDLQCQRREVRAWHQSRMHLNILRENKKITSINRHDHAVMARILLAEAYHHDPKRKQNTEKWMHIRDGLMKECYGNNSIMSIAPDPHQSVLAKLSSMMLWVNSVSPDSEVNEVRCWTYKYNEEEMTRRHLVMNRTLAELKVSSHQYPLKGAQRSASAPVASYRDPISTTFGRRK